MSELFNHSDYPASPGEDGAKFMARFTNILKDNLRYAALLPSGRGSMFWVLKGAVELGAVTPDLYGQQAETLLLGATNAEDMVARTAVKGFIYECPSPVIFSAVYPPLDIPAPEPQDTFIFDQVNKELELLQYSTFKAEQSERVLTTILDDPAILTEGDFSSVALPLLQK
jgi:hypothetical protein